MSQRLPDFGVTNLSNFDSVVLLNDKLTVLQFKKKHRVTFDPELLCSFVEQNDDLNIPFLLVKAAYHFLRLW